jgi:uncharacterized protein
MEEILASIRRIIADDDAAKPEEAPQDNDDVLDLAEIPDSQVTPRANLDVAADIAVREPSGIEDFHPEPEPDPQPEALAATPEPLPASEPIAMPFVPMPEPPRAEAAEPPAPIAPPSQGMAETLVSSATTASVSQAFGLLSNTILSQNARTLEDIVREMLRPMLKVWLDDNLPPLVERLVRAEIERVARGSR